MKIKKLTVDSSLFPERLRIIADPPQELYVAGAELLDLLTHPTVTIVGSRKVSAYGRAATWQLAAELARAGVVVISGLALGVDSIAHRAALDAGGLTISVLPASLSSIYPASHRGLAQQIVAQGGALVSEYGETGTPHKHQFIARNRIASALGDALVITEAAAKSGTLHTAQFALEQGKEVMAIPGNITSATSEGTNQLIRSGAQLVTSVRDIFHTLGIKPAATRAPQSDNPLEQQLLDLIRQGVSDGSQLLTTSGLQVQQFNQALTMLEIKGLIRAVGGNQWSL